MENLTGFNSFKDKKHGSKLNEGVVKIGNAYVVSDVEIPVSLVNAFIKKVKDESGRNLREIFSDNDVAYRLLKYCVENNMIIDNLPSSIVLGDGTGNVEVTDDMGGQVQQSGQTPQTQAQAQAQPQTQTQAQPVVQTPPAAQQTAQTGATQTQKTVQEIPAQETGGIQEI
jgi:hypothetical protein